MEYVEYKPGYTKPLNKYYNKTVQINEFLVDTERKRLLKYCYNETGGKYRYKYIPDDDEVELKYGPKDKRPVIVKASECVEYILSGKKYW